MAKTKKTSSKIVTSPRARTAKALFLHRRHSFKIAHHRHTSYPVAMFLLVTVTVFSIIWTSLAMGAGYDVNAVVPASVLTSPAIIDQPIEGTVFTSQVMTASGVCPVNSYVKLSNNHAFVGAALCQGDGSWSVQITLTEGTNILHAQDYNVTDQAGPASNDVTVYYRPIIPVEPSPGIGVPAVQTTPEPALSSTSHPVLAPLQLGSDFTYRGYTVGQTFSWQLSISGGKAPYAVQVDWGDGETDLKSVTEAGNFTVEHAYSQPVTEKNTYTIKLTVTDNAGNTSLLNLFTVVTPGATGEGASNIQGSSGNSTPGNNNTSSVVQKFWHYAAPTVAISGVALAGFWVGEASKLGLLHSHVLLKAIHLPHLFK